MENVLENEELERQKFIEMKKDLRKSNPLNDQYI